MQAIRNILVAAITAAALGACAPATEQAANGIPTRNNTQLLVKNNNWLDVAVYLVRGGSRTRVGTVTSMAQAQFRIPDSYVLGVSDITVQADPIGSNRTFTSAPIQVYPGARVELTVENAVQLSNFAVYNGAPLQ